MREGRIMGDGLPAEDAPSADDGTETLRGYLQGCCERADRVGFMLHDGRHFQGWVADLHPSPAGDGEAGETDDRDPDLPERPASMTGPCALLSWAPSPFHVQASADGSWAPDDEWIPLSTVVPVSASRSTRTTPGWIPYPG
ncbi:hypothetical protein ACIQ9E_09675 [Streptomyces sp. NPDC094448]|uniref:hypothetical protein n=1 Tax=Streptomyces sp. NPDC094448 TaxID=3366063 RepID=UPI00381092AD